MKKILFALFVFSAAFAEECPKKEICLQKKEVVTEHSAKIGGKVIDYTAIAGTMPLYDSKGEAEAEIFFIAYLKKSETDPGKRPITFCFNGGPGSSSVWLHLGAFGPQKVAMTPDGRPLKPYHLEENPYSLLDQTDLVFIDPVSTGHSRAAPSVDVKKFHGVEPDIKAVAEFIRSFVTHHNRWGSPKFLAGESYGTTRAAGLANELLDDYYLDLSGVMLVSCILDFQAYRFALGNDLPYMTFLPTYAAINWYHTGQKGTLDKVIEEANAFALGPYALALIQGNALPKEEKGKIAEKIAELTGLNRYFIEAADLRVDWLKFAKRRFDNDRKIVSRFDGRFLGYDMDPLSCNNYSDPTLDMLAPAFTSTINQYLTQVLKWEKDLEYEVLTQVSPWDYAAKATNQYLNMNKDLLELMSRDAGVKVFVANGYYDLATPFMASEYTFNHLPIAEPLRKNITFANYAAGHMMYINQKELVRLSTDLRKFITGAAAARSAHPGQVSNGKD